MRSPLSVRLTNHPDIQIRLHSDFAPDLIRAVTGRELDLAQERELNRSILAKSSVNTVTSWLVREMET